MKIIALIPAYNEEARLGKTVETLKKFEELSTIIVIDDGSIDNTAQVGRESGAEVISIEENKGKGNALNTGWQACYADIYLMIDADLEGSAILAKELLYPVIGKRADMTIANFSTAQASGKMGFGLAKIVAKWGIKYFTGFSAISPLSGQRAVRREIFEAIDKLPAGFGVETALTISALKKGFTVKEIGLPITHRATGRNFAGFKHRGRQLYHLCCVLWKFWGAK